MMTIYNSTTSLFIHIFNAYIYDSLCACNTALETLRADGAFMVCVGNLLSHVTLSIRVRLVLRYRLCARFVVAIDQSNRNSLFNHWLNAIEPVV